MHASRGRDFGRSREKAPRSAKGQFSRAGWGRRGGEKRRLPHEACETRADHPADVTRGPHTENTWSGTGVALNECRCAARSIRSPRNLGTLRRHLNERARTSRKKRSGCHWGTGRRGVIYPDGWVPGGKVQIPRVQSRRVLGAVKKGSGETDTPPRSALKRSRGKGVIQPG